MAQEQVKSTGHVGIFGGTMSGKTTLAKSLSVAYFRTSKTRSIVADKWGSNWGAQARVHKGAESWKNDVLKARSCAIFFDEATTMFDRNDPASIAYFTEIRHLGHKMHIIGHRGTAIAPVMREQLSTVYLFKQRGDQAKFWADFFCFEEIEELSPKLNQFEFLVCHLFKKPEVKKLQF